MLSDEWTGYANRCNWADDSCISRQIKAVEDIILETTYFAPLISCCIVSCYQLQSH